MRTINLFLHKKIKTIPKARNFNIILSPEFYWIRVFEIPTNSLKKAKRLAPSLFEDFIEIEDKSFYLKKLSDFKYIVIAYNEEEIKAFLKEKNIFSKVKSIYFAQFEFKFDECIEIDGLTLINQEGIILKFPKKLNCKKFDLNDIKLSKEKLILNEFSLLNNTQIKILISILLISSILNFAKYFYIKNQIDSIPKKIEKLKKDYSLYPSLMQTKAIIKELNQKKDKYKKFRDKLEKILNFKRYSTGQIESIEFKNNKFRIILNSNNQNLVINYFKKLNLVKKEIDKNKIILWIKLWGRLGFCFLVVL